MKIAITGHTCGIGKAINGKMVSLGHTVIGFSLENNYNISKDKMKIIMESKCCDVFVNCAFNRKTYDFAQQELFHSLFMVWENEEKTIINIISDCVKSFNNQTEVPLRNNPKFYQYRAAKNALYSEAYNLSLKKNTKCRVMNLNPGWVETQSTEKIKVPKMKVEDVAEVVALVVGLPNHIVVNELTFRRKD